MCHGIDTGQLQMYTQTATINKSQNITQCQIYHENRKIFKHVHFPNNRSVPCEIYSIQKHTIGPYVVLSYQTEPTYIERIHVNDTCWADSPGGHMLITLLPRLPIIPRLPLHYLSAENNWVIALGYQNNSQLYQEERF